MEMVSLLADAAPNPTDSGSPVLLVMAGVTLTIVVVALVARFIKKSQADK